MKEKRILIVIVLSVLLSGLCALGTFGQEKIVLTFPSWQTEEAGVADWWNALVAEFQKLHPEVTFERSAITPSRKHSDQMLIRIAAGDPPDVLHLPASHAPGFADQGLLQPLDKWISTTDILENWSPLQGWFDYKGHQWGVLLMGYGYLLYYNEKMFDDAGIDVPTNMWEFMRAAKALTKDTDGDGVTDQYGYVMESDASDYTVIRATEFIIDAGTHWTTDEGKLAVTTPQVVEGLERLRELAQAGAIPLGVDHRSRPQIFYEGKAAMMMDGPWVVAAIPSQASPGLAPFLKMSAPAFNPGAGGPSNSLHIAAGLDEERANLAWEFIYLATRPEWQQAYATIGKNIPPRQDIWTEEFKAENPVVAAQAEVAGRVVRYIPKGFETRWAQFAEIASTYVLKVISTNTPIRDILHDFEVELKRAFPDAA